MIKFTGSNIQPNLRRDMTWLCRKEFNNVMSSNYMNPGYFTLAAIDLKP